MLKQKNEELSSTHTPTDQLHWATAEATVVILLSIAKRVTKLYGQLLTNNVPEYSPIGEMSIAVRYKTTGIVGLGNIGSKVAKVMKNGFNNRVLYYGRSRKEELETTLEAEKVTLNDLFLQSDFIFLTIPLTPKTEKLITKEQIGLMKPKSILVSVVPTNILDEVALIDAVEKNKIYGAGLDVYTSKLTSLSSHKLLLTSHMVNSEEDVTLAMAELCIKNIVQVLTNKKPLTPIKANNT